MMSPSQKSSKIWLVLAFLSLIGAIVAHGYLATRHYQLSYGLTLEDSVCNINETFNCDDVNMSPYAKFFGIPISLFGLVTNVMALLLFFFTLKNKRPENFSPYNFYIAFFIAAVSLVMGLVSFVSLGQYCLFCIAIYILSFLYFFCVGRALPKPSLKNLATDIKNLFGKSFLVLILILLIVPITYAANNKLQGHYAGLKEQQTQNPKNNTTDVDQITEQNKALNKIIMQWAQAPLYEFDTTGAISYGALEKEAVMTIIEFADFMCPHCKDASEEIQKFVDSYPDVRWIFINHPIDKSCNPYVGRTNGISCQLAKTVLCTANHEKSWEIHQWLYRKQTAFAMRSQTQELFGKLVETFHIDQKKLDACIASNETQKTLTKQIEESRKANIRSTPSIFVNGRFLPLGQNHEILEVLYDTILENP